MQHELGRNRHTKWRAARALLAAAAGVSSLLSACDFEALGDFRDGTVGGAAAALDKIARDRTHTRRPLRVAHELNPSDASVLRTFYLNSSPGSRESLRNLREIFHRRSKYWNLSERRWLQ